MGDEGVLALRPHQENQRDRDADGNETIGKVECWPVIGRPVEIQKIYDFAIQDSIDEVTDGTTENECERSDQPRFLLVQPL